MRGAARGAARDAASALSCNVSRRAFMVGALFGAGYLLANEDVFGASATATSPDATDMRLTSLTYRIEYLTDFYTESPAKEVIRMWIPLPVEDREQIVSNLSIRSKYPYVVNKASDVSAVFIETGGIKKGTCASLRFTVKRKTAVIDDSDVVDKVKLLKLSEWEKTDEAIAKYVDETIGKETDPVKMARKLYDGIIDRTAYTHELCSRGVSALAFEDKAGRCDDFHAMFRTMMARKDMPVKWEQGVLLPYRAILHKKATMESDCINSHSWCRFFTGGKSIPVDLSEAKRWPNLRDFCFGRLTPNRIKFSTGRGLTLNPPQSEILNTFSYTHVEADGVPMIYGHNYRTFIKYELIGKER